MKIYSPDYYKLKAIVQSPKYKAWENKLKLRLKLPENAYKLDGPKFIRLDEQYDLTGMYYDTENPSMSLRDSNECCLMYSLKNHPDLRDAIIAMLQSFNIAVNYWFIYTTYYYIFFRTFETPFSGVISLTEINPNTLDLQIDKNVQKKDWTYIWYQLEAYLKERINNELDIKVPNDDEPLKLRERDWITYERDVEVYLLYKKINKNPKHYLAKRANKSIYDYILDSKELNIINYRYSSKFDANSLSVAVSRCSKLLDAIDFY